MIGVLILREDMRRADMQRRGGSSASTLPLRAALPPGERHCAARLLRAEILRDARTRLRGVERRPRRRAAGKGKGDAQLGGMAWPPGRLVCNARVSECCQFRRLLSSAESTLVAQRRRGGSLGGLAHLAAKLCPRVVLSLYIIALVPPARLPPRRAPRPASRLIKKFPVFINCLPFPAQPWPSGC